MNCYNKAVIPNYAIIKKRLALSTMHVDNEMHNFV